MHALDPAFESFNAESVALESAWTCEVKRPLLRELVERARAMLAAVRPSLEPPACAGGIVVIEVAAFVETYAAFRAVLTLGMFLREYAPIGHAAAIAPALRAIGGALDALAPYVRRRDQALRRVLIDNVAFDDATAALALSG